MARKAELEYSIEFRFRQVGKERLAHASGISDRAGRGAARFSLNGGDRRAMRRAAGRRGLRLRVTASFSATWGATARDAVRFALPR